jgi:hypothetical protein
LSENDRKFLQDIYVLFDVFCQNFKNGFRDLSSWLNTKSKNKLDNENYPTEIVYCILFNYLTIAGSIFLRQSILWENQILKNSPKSLSIQDYKEDTSTNKTNYSSEEGSNKLFGKETNPVYDYNLSVITSTRASKGHLASYKTTYHPSISEIINNYPTTFGVTRMGYYLSKNMIDQVINVKNTTDEEINDAIKYKMLNMKSDVLVSAMHPRTVLKFINKMKHWRNLTITKDSIAFMPCAGYGGSVIASLLAEFKNITAVEPNKQTCNGITSAVAAFKDANSNSENVTVTLIQKPIEDLDIGKDYCYLTDKVDFAYCCPPYFDLEKYDENCDTQSSNRYETWELWKNSFLIPLIKSYTTVLKPNGMGIGFITIPLAIYQNQIEFTQDVMTILENKNLIIFCAKKTLEINTITLCFCKNNTPVNHPNTHTDFLLKKLNKIKNELKKKNKAKKNPIFGLKKNTSESKTENFLGKKKYSEPEEKLKETEINKNKSESKTKNVLGKKKYTEPEEKLPIFEIKKIDPKSKKENLLKK